MKDFFLKNKFRIMAAIVIAAVLTFAFLYDDGKPGNDRTEKTSAQVRNIITSESIQESIAAKEKQESYVITEDNSEAEGSISEENPDNSAVPEKSEAASGLSSKTEKSGKEETQEELSETVVSNPEESLSQEASSEESSIPVPEEKPEIPEQPVSEPESSDECILTINCETALRNERLDRKIRSLQPSDGRILSVQVSWNEGETAFDILERACRENGIRLISSAVPFSGGRYIERINDLGEFDCGNLSGWMISVNDEFITVSCSDYKVYPGDRIAFLYTCDLGEDIGNHYIAQ